MPRVTMQMLFTPDKPEVSLFLLHQKNGLGDKIFYSTIRDLTVQLPFCYFIVVVPSHPKPRSNAINRSLFSDEPFIFIIPITQYHSAQVGSYILFSLSTAVWKHKTKITSRLNLLRRKLEVCLDHERNSYKQKKNVKLLRSRQTTLICQNQINNESLLRVLKESLYTKYQEENSWILC